MGHTVRTIALLPLASFIWLIGWTLYCIGDQRMNQSTQKENTDVFKTRDSKKKLNEASRQIVA